VTPGIAPDRRSAWLPGFLANAVIWGSSFIFIKIAVDVLHPTWVAAGRLGAGALALLAILMVTKTRLPAERRVWGHMVVPGVIGTAVPFALFAYGEERVSSIVAGIWNATTALWVLPFAVFVYRTEKFTIRAAAGLALGFAGVLVVLGFWQAQASDLVGQLMCGAAALCYGITIPYIKRFISGSTTASGVSLAAVQVIIGAVASTVAALVLSGPPPSPGTWGWEVVGSIIALGVFGSGIAFALNMRVIEVKGASTTAFVTYLIPVVATILGVTVMSETFTWNQPVGAAIVLAGVAYAQGLFSGMRRRPGQQLLGRPRVDDPVRS
jgi:drug/metabolite transporter (DMT)-like permease